MSKTTMMETKTAVMTAAVATVAGISITTAIYLAFKKLFKHKTDYWVDGNNNKWSKSKYSEERAKELSKTLVGCTNCVNCAKCERCVDCTDCLYCKDSVGCLSCSNCKDCMHCLHCETCDECNSCFRCNFIEGCVECTCNEAL